MLRDLLSNNKEPIDNGDRNPLSKERKQSDIFKSLPTLIKRYFENNHDDFKGDKGEDGKDGLNGKDGRNGEQGIQGLKGGQGERGEKGEQGDEGDKGGRGLNGLDGVDGIDGSPDTPEEIKEKLKELPIEEEWFDHKHIKGLKPTVIQQVGSIGGGVSDHKKLKNLEWSNAGHTIDKDIDMNGHGFINWTYNLETSTGETTISDNVSVHVCNGTVDYELTLPQGVTGKQIKIINKGDVVVTLIGSLNRVPSVGALYKGESIVMIYDGIEWI